jgi:hypothetical protein
MSTQRSLRRLVLVAPALLLLSLAACTSNAPAQRPTISTHPTSPAVSGAYKVTFTAPLVGSICTYMTAAPTAEGFTATTREGIAWKFIGGMEGLLGRAFVPKLFPDGIILTWTTPLPRDGKPAQGRIGAGKFRGASITTRMTSLSGDIELLTSDGRRVGMMRMEPCSAAEAPADYRVLATNIQSAVESRLFDRDLASSGQVRSYLSQVRGNARIAQDDVEFIFGSAVAGRSLKFSLPLVIKDASLDAGSAAAAGQPRDLATIAVAYSPETRIATIRIDAFLSAEDVDMAFTKALAHDPAGLFIDLKNCPGVTLASLRVLSWISDTPVDAGIFFGQQQREAVLKARGSAQLPTIRIATPADIAQLESTLDTTGAARIILDPFPAAYRGPVALRVSKRTTTSAEPLAHLLKTSGRARIFGERTAGRPYLSRPVDIGQGWLCWIATCDYRGPRGERIDAKGIKPDVELSSKERAREAATAWLVEQNSSAATTVAATASAHE